MTDRSALVDTAARLGIAARHTDALGRTREVSDEALLALIGAFGFSEDPLLARHELEEEARQAPLGLAPMHLVRAEDRAPILPLRLPPGTREILWSCRLEDGERRSGSARPDCEGEGSRYALLLPAGLPLGYHRLALAAGGVEAEISLIVAPPRCYLPDALGPGAGSWGLTCQLYGLRRADNWGIGDFTDLAALGRTAGSRGAAALGINPLHALFAAEPLHFTPYSPSSRNRINYLYIDVTAVPGFAGDEGVHGLLHEDGFALTRSFAQAAELIDYGAVAACKRPVLEALYRRFRARELAAEGVARSPLGEEFRRFQKRGGRELHDFALFEALHEYYYGRERHFSWTSWPLPMRDPRSPEVAEFARAHCERVEFFEFLQWEADRQLAAAAAAGRAGGLSLGLYRDLAVGANPNGAEAWSDQELVAPGAAIGAPPDPLSLAGQNWGLAPINPLVLRRRGFAPFVHALRANMLHAGVLRIDHVMSLSRLYWVPNGMEARSGAYVAYPFETLLRLAALESCRQHCAVIGEDLGTVPEGFRESMERAQVLSYRVAMFERRDGGAFVPPREYPPLAAASAATHDIATVKGFWLGTDIAWRCRLSLYPDAEAQDSEARERGRDRRLLLEALVAEGLLAPERFGEFLSEAGEPVYSTELGDAILLYLARSRARLMLVQLEDVIAEGEQANLPGTTDAHPNWRRRMPRSFEDGGGKAELRRIAALIAAARPPAKQG
ncbi:MAG TPA: 4-alpha-glucanotransferase [Stellaceae bacterium]|nr:4-alpha-glucanotransferase [Stellaceae bacterium]